jgi:hypothetical protein
MQRQGIKKPAPVFLTKLLSETIVVLHGLEVNSTDEVKTLDGTTCSREILSTIRWSSVIL